MRVLRKPSRTDIAALLLIAAGTGSAIAAATAAPTMVETNAIKSPRAATGLQVAARDDAQIYYQAYRLIGSYVLNLSGERIGQVDDLVINNEGKVTQVLVALKESIDMDGSPVPISPYRAEVVSVAGSAVTVIRVDLTREEIVQAQLTRLKTDARAPVSRGTDRPDQWRHEDPLF